VSVALEQLAAAMAPGPVLSTCLAVLLLGAEDRAAELGASRFAAVALAAPELRVDEAGWAHGVVRVVPGMVADALLVAPDATGSWHLIDTANDAVKVVELEAADLSRPLADVHLAGVPAIALPDLTTARVHELAATLAAAEAAGIAQHCLRTATDYAKIRVQFGKPIGANQAIKHLCADMLCQAEVSAAAAWDAAEASTDEREFELASSAAAVLAVEAAVANARDCIQVLGGIGYTWEHDAHLYLRRAWALRHWLGASGQWRARVAALTANGVRRTLRAPVSEARSANFDPEVETVRATAERIAATPSEQRRRALAESGYLVPHWPVPYGLGAGPALQLLIDAELERAGVVRPDLVIAGWALPTIVAHGTDAQRERFVRPTLLGDIEWCQLFSEPEAGSDLAGLRTRAERVEGGWRLTGQKVWTSVAHRAHWGVCLARSNPDVAKHRGITYFLVDMTSPGLAVRPLRELTGEALFNEVFLDGVFVPDDCVVGEVDGGWPLARGTLSQERVAMGRGSSIGEAVEQLVHEAVADGSIDDPRTAERLGGLVCDGLAGSLLDLRTTLLQLRGEEGASASVRKLVGVQHRQDVAQAGLERAGADALVDGQAMHDYLVSRCLSIAGGTTQILRTLAAERLLGLPRD
jgi:alkylation response protein AidB-like acyl-CoA dehydrogenase